MSKYKTRQAVIATLCIVLVLFFVSISPSNNKKTRPIPLPLVNTKDYWPPLVEDSICRPKIYVYDIPDTIQVSKTARETTCYRSNYKSEIMLHDALTDPSSIFYKLYVTEDPEEAELFYIPFFGSCWLFSQCWSQRNWNFEERCGVDDAYVNPVMDYIIKSNPYWNRTGGLDHLMVHPMDHTYNYYQSNQRFQPAIFLTTIGDKREAAMVKLRYGRDIVIPSATELLHMAKLDPMHYLTSTGGPQYSVVGSRKRNILALFRGLGEDNKPGDIYSHGVRSLLFSYFRHLPNWDIADRASSEEYAVLLARSKYGLAPEGWTLDTTRVWEYIAFGVVPVIIADGIVEPFENDVDWDSFSVRVRRSEVHRLDEILHSISEEEYERKRTSLWEHGRRIGLEKEAWHFIVRDLCRIRHIHRPENLHLGH
ncbi:hypothetical protein VKS41_001211 [Umbelopsis sp. WA50703]|jgi:hypothetical protein